MSKYIHNISGVEKTYEGTPIANGSFYQIPLTMEASYASNDTILLDITSGDIVMSKDGSTDITSGTSYQIDFLKSLLQSEVKIQELPAFGSKTGHSFKGRGIEKNCIKNSETDIEWVVDDTYDLSGVEILNGALGDHVQLMVVDDNLGTYSTVPDYILDQFGIDWKIRPDVFIKDLPYTARLMTGMILRFRYLNKDITNDRMIYVNLDLHKVTP